jgi:hypothetical protein
LLTASGTESEVHAVWIASVLTGTKNEVNAYAATLSAAILSGSVLPLAACGSTWGSSTGAVVQGAELSPDQLLSALCLQNQCRSLCRMEGPDWPVLESVIDLYLHHNQQHY